MKGNQPANTSPVRRDSAVPRRIWVISLMLVILLSLETGFRVGAWLFENSLKSYNRQVFQQKPSIRLLCIGESMTALDRRDSFPCLLNQMAAMQKLGVGVFNGGLPGINSLDIARRLSAQLKQIKPQFVLSMIGINDNAIFPITLTHVQRVIYSLKKGEKVPILPLGKRLRCFEFFRGVLFFLSGKTFTLNLSPTSPTACIYRYIHYMIYESGAMHLCIPYPLTDPLNVKKALGNQKMMDIIDTNTPFRHALAEKPYSYFFKDNFAGSFGHLTKEGNRLLAQTIAEYFTKGMFPKKMPWEKKSAIDTLQ